MSKLTLENYHLVTGQRFRMLKEQKARGLTREQAFAETHEEIIPVTTRTEQDITPLVKLAEPVIVSKPTPPIVETRDLLSEARKLAERERMTYSRLRRELRITWQRSADLMETLYH